MSAKIRQILASGSLAWRGICLLAAYAATLSLSLTIITSSRGGSAAEVFGIGLGLSIAKSLTELQGGTFTIVIDGDLFKASVCLPHHA